MESLESKTHVQAPDTEREGGRERTREKTTERERG